MHKLVAVRPNSTVDVEIQGVKFKVGVIPRIIHAEYIEFVQKLADSKQIDVDKLAAEGEEIDAKAIDLTRVSFKELSEMQAKVVRFGLKGTDLAYEDGEAIKLEFDEFDVSGYKFKGLTDESLEILHSAGVMTDISNKILNRSNSGEGKQDQAS